MKLKLIYPSPIYGNKPQAKATAEARETKTLWIVSRENVTMQTTTGPVFGMKEVRFRKKTGLAIGNVSKWKVVLD